MAEYMVRLTDEQMQEIETLIAQRMASLEVEWKRKYINKWKHDARVRALEAIKVALAEGVEQ